MKTISKLTATAVAVLGLAVMAGPAGAQMNSTPQNGAMATQPMQGDDRGMGADDSHHAMHHHMSHMMMRCHSMMMHHRHMTHHQRMACHSMMHRHMMQR